MTSDSAETQRRLGTSAASLRHGLLSVVVTARGLAAGSNMVT
jgi:hypothetical protein